MTFDGRKRRGGIARVRVACPECGEVFTITYRRGLRRFRAKMHRCPECGFVGRRGAFDDPYRE